MDNAAAIASLAALAQDTRLAVYRALVEAGPTGLSVGEIGAQVKAAPATLSFHLKELAHARLVLARQDGRYIFYSANFGHMNDLLEFLSRNCCARDGLACAAACGPDECAPRATRDPAAARPGRGKRPSTRRAARGVSKT